MISEAEFTVAKNFANKYSTFKITQVGQGHCQHWSFCDKWLENYSFQEEMTFLQWKTVVMLVVVAQP